MSYYKNSVTAHNKDVPREVLRLKNFALTGHSVITFAPKGGRGQLKCQRIPTRGIAFYPNGFCNSIDTILY